MLSIDCKKRGLPLFFSLLGAHIKCIFPSQIFGPCFFFLLFFVPTSRYLKIDIVPFWEAKLGPSWPRFGVHVGPFHATLLVLAVKCIFQSNVQHTITLTSNLQPSPNTVNIGVGRTCAVFVFLPKWYSKFTFATLKIIIFFIYFGVVLGSFWGSMLGSAPRALLEPFFLRFMLILGSQHGPRNRQELCHS